jgi:3-hydroxyisobutyrate dehydrogenase-like beta-hydroxyacid dehydrogenase
MNIGFVGLGLMGGPMANRILDAGHRLCVYNRTKEKSTPFLAKGAVWCDSPREVAQKSEILFSMLSTPDVLENTTLGKNGIVQGARPEFIHVDCSTVSPILTKRLHEQYRSMHSHFLHSPVLGSVPNATDGSLLLFVGGEDEAFVKARDILKLFGNKIWRFERVEQASNTKLLCNFFIASMISGLAQGLVFAERNSIDPKVFLDILSQSALNAPTYQTKGKSMIENSFAPRFFVEHMLKDINLLLDSAKESGATMPNAEVAKDLYTKAMNSGLGKEDYSSVIKTLRSPRQI